MRAAEAPHVAAGEPLMAFAAAGLAATIREELSALRVPLMAAEVLLLVGSGNNGGDALFAGAELSASGCSVSIAELGSRVHEPGLRAALDAGACVIGTGAEGVAKAVDVAAHTDVIVDGILGTGAGTSSTRSEGQEAPRTSALRGPARDAVAALIPLAASPRRRVVAVDVPSGVDPDTGEVHGEVLPADVTVTFGAYKAGLLRPPGSGYAGRITLVDIGLGPDLENVEPLLTVVD